MSLQSFRLPDVGEGLTEAEIVTWKVKPGDTVKVNDIVVEIETAKSLVELPDAVRRCGRRAAGRRGADGRCRHADHRGRRPTVARPMPRPPSRRVRHRVRPRSRPLPTRARSSRA